MKIPEKVRIGIGGEEYTIKFDPNMWDKLLRDIRNRTGQPIENEDEVLEMFAKRICKFFQDNGARMFDLKNGSGSAIVSFCFEDHTCPLEIVTELQQDECLRNGLTCEEADGVQADG